MTNIMTRMGDGYPVELTESQLMADLEAGTREAAEYAEIDPLSKEGQVELSRNLQIATAAIDSTGMCLFIAFAALDDATCLPALIDLINARFGISLTADDVVNLGQYILKTEHSFNQAAGFTKEDDRLPEFFSYEPVAPHNAVWDFEGEELDTFWNF